ncbi:AARP2CN-like protein [Cynara cardunculus var. scolymus]|uniref:AARP2CN-like protein n=1 Tax=Cynara cardunculus var. scolymus TaxID=59895 RepID=A0A103YEQ0_CYNCS|nr:AARP2CN-like protein [Cynara cardunculus var. scolymus]
MAGGSRAQVNKSHKTRFASKASRNIHKTSVKDKSKISKPDRNVGKGARAARLQRNKMMREQKRAALLKEKRAFSGTTSAPRVIVLFGLSASTNVSSLAGDLLALLSNEKNGTLFPAVASPEYRLRATDLPPDLKRRNDLKKTCISSLASEFPEDCKIYPADTKDDLHKFMSLYKEQRPTIPHWRTQRPYVMAQKVDVVADGSGKCTLLVTGYIRARNLSVNQLVHVSGAGDFQMSKIELLKDPCLLNVKKEGDFMDADEVNDSQAIRTLVPDPLKQEPLLVENVPNPLEGEQTWPTEAEMAEADREQKEKKQKKSDDGSDNGMVVDEGEYDFAGQNDGGKFDLEDDQASLKLRDSDEETEADSVMMYPDEVDVPVDVPARKRFAKYRGLKSFRTSSWDPKESLPPEYARIFAFDNFTRTQKHVLSKALDMEQGSEDECVPANSYVKLHITEVPTHIASKLCVLVKTMPVIACGLLQHESKISFLHFRVKKHETYTEPIKAKEELIFHVGFRQFVTRPTFASDNFNSDKHKMERFLHAGRFSIASVYAPISFPPLPLIVLKSRGDSSPPALAAVGSLKTCGSLDKIGSPRSHQRAPRCNEVHIERCPPAERHRVHESIQAIISQVARTLVPDVRRLTFDRTTVSPREQKKLVKEDRCSTLME